MIRKSGKISVLQVDSLGVSWMRIHPGASGGAALEFARVDAGAAPEAQVEALSSLAREHALAGDQLCTVLPRHEITARVLVLPTQDQAEAASMVRLNAEEYVPYSLNELILGTRIVELLPNGESRVFAVLAHKEVVEQHVQLLRKAGLAPQRIFLSTACLASAAEAAGLSARGACALVHLGANSLEVIALRAGALQFTRGLAAGQDWRPIGTPEGRDALEELGTETRSSLSSFRRESEDGMGADFTFLAADYLDVATACEALRGHGGPDLQEPPRPALFEQTEALAGRPFPWVLAGAALTALGQASLDIDLLPEDLAKARRSEQVQRLVRHALVAAVAVLTAAGLYFGQQIHARNRYVRELSAQVAALAPQAEGIARKRQQLSLLQEQVERNGTVLELIARATAMAPEAELTLSQFDYDSEQGVNLFGRARQRESVVKYSQDLRNLAENGAALWSAASVIYIQEGVEFDKNVFMFQIQARYEADAEGEADDAAAE